VWLNIQALRALAAYMVVFHHLIDSWNSYVGTEFRPIPLTIGAGGVDIFFVISGFVIVEATTGKALSPLAFLRRRIRRIVPLYWLLSVLAAIGMALGLRLFGEVGVSIGPDLMRSLLFVPIFTPDGAPRFPILFVGWSLNYEMFFYVLFALTLLLERAATRVAAIAALFLILTVAAQASGNHVLRYYASPCIWEFVLGMVIAVNAGTVRATAQRHSWALGWIILGAGALLLLVSCEVPLLPTAAGQQALLRGPGAALIVLGAVYLECGGRHALADRLRHQGDASYSLYLTHPFVIQLGGKAIIVLGINATIAGTLLGLAATAVAAALVGTAVHQLIEKPMLRQGRATLAYGMLVSGKRKP
jgi:exopolysaccharide production protein ExoZ